MGPEAQEPWIPEAVDASALRGHVEALCRWDRVSGLPGERLAGEYLVSVLRELGVGHEVHEIDAYVSYPMDASLEVDRNLREPLRVTTHPFTATTPPDGVTASLTDSGDGSPETINNADLRGKIAVIWDMALPWVAERVQAAGAVGLVNVCRSSWPHEMCMSNVWGSPEPKDLDRMLTIPVVSTDESGGRILRAALASGVDVQATLRTRVWTGWSKLLLPVARIRPNRPSEEFVLVSSHYDSWYKGATDTGATDALLLEMARLLWSHRDRLEREVRIAWWPGHSQGRYAGSTWYADRFWSELHRGAVAYLNLDGGGAIRARRFVLAHTAELADFNMRTVAEITGWPAEEVADEELEGFRGRPARNADQSFLGIGVSSLAAYSEMPRDDLERGFHAAASGGGWWWHTPEDTPDKVDYEVLRLETILFTVQAFRLASTELLPYRPTALVDDVLQLLQTYEGSATGFLDFRPAREQAQRLRKASEELEGRRHAMESHPEVYNRALLGLTRILNPILYTSRGRFHPDPATPSTLLPGLADARRLNEMPETTRRFALVGLVREMNRLVHGLEEANALVESTLRGLRPS